MRDATILSAACAVSALVASGSASIAEVVLTQGTEGGKPTIRLENEHLVVAVEPDTGGRISSLIDRRNGFDGVVENQGYLLDMFMHQPYPGELQRYGYEAEVLDETPARAGVRLRRRAGEARVLGVVVEKTIWLAAGARAVDVDYRFLNESDAYRSFSFWTQHFCRSGESKEGDVYFRPGAAGITPVPYPGSEAYPDVVEEPAAGWTAVVDPDAKVGTVFLFDYDWLRWSYNAFAAGTLEWFTDTLLVAPGAAWETRVTILPIAGLDGVSYASRDLVAFTQVDRGAGSVDVRLEILSMDGSTPEVVSSLALLDEGGTVVGESELRSSTDPGGALVHRVKLESPVAQGLLMVELAAGGDVARYAVNLPDAEGKVDRVMALRTRPPKLKEYPERPADFRLTGNEPFNVLVLAGPGFQRFRLDRLEDAEAATSITWGYFASRVIRNAVSYGVDYFPADYDELAAFDAMVFAGLGAYVLEDYMRNMVVDYLEIGGRVLLLGGTTAMNGWAGEGNPLREVVPLRDPGPFTIKRFEYPASIGNRDAFLQDLFALSDEPVVAFAHEVEPAEPFETVLAVEDRPLLIRRRIGEGEMLVFLGTAFGENRADTFWNWASWPALVRRLLATRDGVRH